MQRDDLAFDSEKANQRAGSKRCVPQIESGDAYIEIVTDTFDGNKHHCLGTRATQETNDLARQVISSVNGCPGDELIIRDALLRYIAAFPVELKCHVIYGSDIADDLRNVIEEDDLSLILQSKHRAGCVIQFISQSLQLLNLDSTKIDALESKMLQLQEGIGVCDQLMGGCSYRGAILYASFKRAM
ncbi:hypothetical protein Bca52824_011261 [Brassica carinata]|uniref:Uncharacterized protein n=1 Tax=Brassica carinata TaxID=52824 RepID=A0A8X7WCX1_BRACI|nr:hypothetical protein Bca52824_011261 [Brassica carinata]